MLQHILMCCGLMGNQPRCCLSADACVVMQLSSYIIKTFHKSVPMLVPRVRRRLHRTWWTVETCAHGGLSTCCCGYEPTGGSWNVPPLPSPSWDRTYFDLFTDSPENDLRMLINETRLEDCDLSASSSVEFQSGFGPVVFSAIVSACFLRISASLLKTVQGSGLGLGVPSPDV